MKSRAEYFKEYRARKGDATLHRKLDLLLEHFGLSDGGDVKAGPVVRPEPAEPIPNIAFVKSQIGDICACGSPAFYRDKKGVYCSQHSTLHSEPIK